MSDQLDPAWGSGGGDRSDLDLFRKALRQEWPVPPAVKLKLLQRAIDIADPETEIGKTASKRTVISALKVLALFMSLNLQQEKNDLARERHELDRGTSGQTLAELVAEAEAAAASHRPAEPPPERTTA